ncbi:MAG: acylase [Pseudomonas sp.]
MFLLALLIVPAAVHAERRDAGEVLWDSYGVPHVYAKSEAGAFYGFGWAQVRSHGDIVLRLYGEARGRAAEYWGAEYADSDRWMAANDVYTRARRWYAAQTPGFKADLDAFARGMTDAARRHPQDIDPELLRVLPITGVDVVAHAHRLMNYVYIASQAKVLGDPPPDSKARDGSNAWAVMPSRTRDGHALLLANPHLPWAPGFFTYYEAHLNAPGIDVYGATQIGLPVIRFAFNPDLGFTNTVNTLLGATVYQLKLSGDGYLFDGQRRDFTVEHKRIRVRQADGTLKDEDFDVRHSVHGPVFTRHDGTTVALRVAGLDRPGMLQQYWDMGTARNFEQFQQAVRRVQIPMFNIVYADRQGNIMFLDNGILPRHASGDLKFWSGLVPGDSSATLWDEKDIHSYEELPKVINPPGGFVQNTNDPPWVSTWPRTLDPKDFPDYVAPQGPMSLRAQTSVLSLAGDRRLSFEDFQALKKSTHSLAAERLVPALLALAKDDPDPEIREAAAVLGQWDRAFDASSRGALLFEEWAHLFTGDYKYVSQAAYAVPWTLQDPLATPSGIKDPQKALAQLKEAVAMTRKLYGSIDRAYGEVSRFHIGEVNLPGRGGFGNLGVFDVITWDPIKNGERLPQHGETWVSLVEFGTPLRARGLMSYGNATRAGSPHNSDQLQLLSNGEFRDLWTTREQVEQHLESRDSF